MIDFRAAIAGAALVCTLPARAAAPIAGAPVDVVLTSSTCEPSDLNVSAGSVTFSIRNETSQALEWEILDGVMVVSERENIAPGMARALTAHLAAGDYQVTCGRISNPRGSLHVAAVAGASGKPSLIDLIGPLAEYRFYASEEIDGLLEEARRLAAAVQSGDLALARQAFLAAHLHYARIAPIALFFPDLDGAFEPGDGGRVDLGASGFLQLRWFLFNKGEITDLGPLADKLAADVASLQTRFENLSLTPAPTIAGAVNVMGGSAPWALEGEADGLDEAAANLAGARKLFDLFRPVVAKADASLGRALDDEFAALDAMLAAHKDANGGVIGGISLEDRHAMQALMKKLSGDLAKLPVALGLA